MGPVEDKVTVKFCRLDQAGSTQLPAYASEGASGLDLRACLDEPVSIEPGSNALIATGLALEIPLGFEGQVRPRSGLALKHSIMVVNSPGTIDADYRGELKVILGNFGSEPFMINGGDRIAQLVICPVVQAQVVEVETLSDTERNAGGFGSTGVS